MIVKKLSLSGPPAVFSKKYLSNMSTLMNTSTTKWKKTLKFFKTKEAMNILNGFNQAVYDYNIVNDIGRKWKILNNMELAVKK